MRILVLLSLVLSSLPIWSQTCAVSVIHKASDDSVPTPCYVTQAHSDAAAITAINRFLQATGTTAWIGMTGQGRLSLTRDGDGYPSTISILGTNHTRIETAKPNSTEIMTYNPSRSALRTGSMTQSLSPDMTMHGLVPLPKLFTLLTHDSNSVWVERGVQQIGSQSLHRISWQPASLPPVGAASIDYYFDPATSLLVSTVAVLQLSTQDGTFYTLTTTYDDYRSSGTAVMPFRYHQDVNGSFSWTLQLDTLEVGASPDHDLFN